jgi:transposase, IS30 family
MKKRLDIEDRIIIQACLENHNKISEIAQRLSVNKSTISREIKKFSYKTNGTKFPCERNCYVCNVCFVKGCCTKVKTYYNYKIAEEKSRNLRIYPRSKPKIANEDIKEIDGIVTDGVKNGQSLHHIFISNPELAKICSERTIRRLCYRGNLSVKPHELRRYVIYKHEYNYEKDKINLKDIRVMIGRNYKNYIQKISKNKSMNIVQYDSVIGKRSDKKAILTITFPKYNFQFGILIQKDSPSNVVYNIKKLFRLIGNETVEKIFPINLADNGVEFSSFSQIEIDDNGEKICSSFFTNPYRATDKASCERNHELIRYFLPKGKSFNFLTQEIIDNMFSNINSYVRKSKNDKTPYDLLKRKFGEDFLNKINIKRIPNKKVKLTEI